MTYFFFLAGFSWMGLALLAWLVIGDELETRRSLSDLARLKAVGDRAAQSQIDAMKVAGEGVGEGGASVAEELRRRLRKMAAKKAARPRFDETGEQAERDRKEWDELESYMRVVRLFRETFVASGLEGREFPVRAYSRTNRETQQSVQRLMVLLRSEREAGKAGVSPD